MTVFTRGRPWSSPRSAPIMQAVETPDINKSEQEGRGQIASPICHHRCPASPPFRLWPLLVAKRLQTCLISYLSISDVHKWWRRRPWQVAKVAQYIQLPVWPHPQVPSIHPFIPLRNPCKGSRIVQVLVSFFSFFEVAQMRQRWDAWCHLKAGGQNHRGIGPSLCQQPILL